MEVVGLSRALWAKVKIKILAKNENMAAPRGSISVFAYKRPRKGAKEGNPVENLHKGCMQ